MSQRRAIAAMVLVLGLALAAAMLLLPDGRGASTTSDTLNDQRGAQPCGRPLQMPGTEQPRTLPTPAGTPGPKPASAIETVAAPATPVLDTPDYGPAILRGGAYVDFELYDSRGTRVPVQYYAVKLWRKIGSYWLADEASTDTDRNVVHCDGLGESGIPAAGLEPGELTSERWGNFRHEFSVSRGERRTDRLTTPHTKVAVCFRFSDAAGNPIAYLPARPKVATTAEPLEPRERPEAPTVFLRSPPSQTSGGGGGRGWMGSGHGDGYPAKYARPPLYPTDNGGWWVHVYAGGTNTVTFQLQHDLWGDMQYELVDTFTSRAEIPVTLNTAADFATRVLEWGEPVEGFTPGDRKILDEPLEPPPKPPFDPYTAPVKPGVTRPVIEVSAPVPVSVRVEISLDGENYWNAMYQRENIYWFDMSSEYECWIRFNDDKLLCTPWERVEIIAGGVLLLRRGLNGAAIKISTDGLPPTLRAFAYTIDFDAAASRKPEPDPVEDDSVSQRESTVEDPSNGPLQDLKENPTPEPDSGGPTPARPKNRQEDRRNDKPSDTSLLFKLVMRQQDGAHDLQTIADHPQLAADISHGLHVRTHLRGVSRYRKGRRGRASELPDGRFWYDPLILNGRWERYDAPGSLLDLLQSGSLQPRFDNVFVARAVGPQEEGLPWVRGVILDYEMDAVAQQVREICARCDNELYVPSREDHAARLAAVESAPGHAGLRELMGDDAYDALETDEQRLWFARNGAWYDTYRKVYSDEQGYIARQDPPLEAGKCYVLYLWSNSRDDLRPDARFAFKVDEHGVADLGAIRMPTYE